VKPASCSLELYACRHTYSTYEADMPIQCFRYTNLIMCCTRYLRKVILEVGGDGLLSSTEHYLIQWL
jgi:hypothetical protein